MRYYTDFLSELQGLVDQGWKGVLKGDGVIILIEPGTGKVYMPVHALHKAKTGRDLEGKHIHVLAGILKMSERLARSVHHIAYGKHYNPEDRKDLMRVLRINPKATA